VMIRGFHNLVEHLRAISNYAATSLVAEIESAQKFSVEITPENAEVVQAAADMIETRIQNNSFGLPFRTTLVEVILPKSDSTRWIIAKESNATEVDTRMLIGFEREIDTIAIGGKIIKWRHPAERDQSRGLVDGNVLDLQTGKSHRVSQESEALYGFLGETRNLLYGFCGLLDLHGVIARPREHSQSANATRIRKGLVPFYEHKVLEIDLGKVRLASNSSGGTHASPREHLRRGHIRTLADGREIFVRSCKVGSSDLGRVEKEYSINLRRYH
jgi:hypothetical protein